MDFIMEINEKLLNYLLKQAKIDSIDEVSDNIDFMTDKQILDKHPYAITINKDGRASTYVLIDATNETDKPKRKKLVKATAEELKKTIVKFYREREKQKQEKKLCLKDFYPEWLSYKALHTNSSAYIKTIDELWHRYYKNDSIITIPLVDLDEYTLDTWAHTLIKKHTMTKKQYYNMAIIIRQSLELAVIRHIISESPFRNIKIDAKLFRKVPKKPDETQVYLIDEQPLIEQEAYNDFYATGNTACLAIPLAFQTGLRLSEITTLKFSDINEEKENCIHIQRMETKEYKLLPDGTWSKPIRVVVDRTKSIAGTRNVYLTTKAREIIELIRQRNLECGYNTSGYIFLNSRGRITASALDCRLRKYCNNINISAKSMHKIRKTYISTLIDSENININYIREQCGHEDERTTYGNYCFNRKNKVQTAEEMEKALVRSS